jgi:hypothetical protein
VAKDPLAESLYRAVEPLARAASTAYLEGLERAVERAWPQGGATVQYQGCGIWLAQTPDGQRVYAMGLEKGLRALADRGRT